MPIPSSVADLSTTASSNYPSGSESANQLDDYHRALCAIVRQVSDAKEDTGVAATAITAERTAVATLTNKTLVAPALGAPASGTLTNCTFPTLNQNTTGTAANLSGTPALPNGTTATTQTAGDNSTKIATTAYVATAVTAFTYTSAVTPLPSAGAAVSTAHGLGATPSDVVLEITCLTAELGYSIGDVLQVNAQWNTSIWVPTSVFKNATNVGFNLASGYVISGLNKSTGAGVQFTLANWSYRFRIKA